MRQFFKFLFASCLGTIVAIVVLSFIGFGVLTSLVSSSQVAPEIRSNSVLRLELDGAIPELRDNVQLSSLDPLQPSVLGVHDIVRAIRQAKEDDDIKGILINTKVVQMGLTSTALVREALADFRESGKFVVAQSPYYSQGAYFLASVADEVYLAPQGIVDFRGLSVEIPHFKEMLDKVGLEMATFYAGEFKSATEPYRRKDISPENRLQTRAYLTELYNQLLASVGESREIPESTLREAVDSYAGIDPQRALDAGLIDAIGFPEAAEERLRELIGLEKEADINYVGTNAYFLGRVPQPAGGAERIAVLIAEGTILDGKAKSGSVADAQYVKLIDKIRKDDRVKALVLRVNSPGGSAMASEHIWQALQRYKETGKPLVVSMGNYAASGGYYISAPADHIFAQSGTITGSIGAYSVFPQAQTMLEEKLGIHFDTVKTADLSAAFSVTHPLSEVERRLLQNRTDELYRLFLQRVADGRNMSVEGVDSIARGRVWIGTTAQEIGLVDEIGPLQSALDKAAEMADLADSDYRIIEYPTPVPPFERLLEEFASGQQIITRKLVKDQLGDMYQPYQTLKELTQVKGVQMRLLERVPFQ